MADKVLPPRKIRVPDSALPELSTRVTTSLKCWLRVPRSYLRPSPSSWVRSTSMILALMLTCGWRRSRLRAYAIRSSIAVGTSVIETLLLSESAVTAPRVGQSCGAWLPPEITTVEDGAGVPAAPGAPGVGAVGAEAPAAVLCRRLQSRDRRPWSAAATATASVYWRRTVRV